MSLPMASKCSGRMKYFMCFIVPRTIANTMMTAAHARVQRTNNEVWTKDGGIPTGAGGSGKIPGDDSMYREHDGDDRKGEDVHRVSQMRPLPFGAAETERKRFIQALCASQWNGHAPWPDQG